MSGPGPQVLVVTPGSWHFAETARAFQRQGALAQLWMSDRNKARFAPEKFRWCWPLFAATKPLHFVPGVRHAAEWAFWRALPVWRAWLAAQRYPECDVIHARMGYALEPFAWAERAGRRVLKVVDCTNSHPTTQVGYWQRELDLFAPGRRPVMPRSLFTRMNREIERADVVLCPSDFVRDTMLANGVPAEKCLVQPYGYDPGLFTPREAPPERPRFLFTGTLCLRKGVHYLLRAFALAKRRLPGAELVLMGGLHPDFHGEYRRWAGTFEHIPHGSRDRVARELRRATAFVFPSCEEGFARSIMEALGTGLPVIASHESGASTLLRDGRGGIVVGPRDVEGLAEAMVRLGEDRALNARLGQEARAAVAGRSWDDYGRDVIAQYRARLG